MATKKPANEGAFLLNTHELPRRAGEMKEYELDIAAPFRVGVPLIGVPEGDIIEIDARCESVTEGILVTADIYAVAIGECIRCLDPVELPVDRTIQELFSYEPTDDKGKKNRKKVEEEDDLDEDEALFVEGEQVNLEIPILDAIILSLPVNPLCDEECMGLCPDCGEKWESLPEDHAHDVVDARWAGLGALDLGSSGE
ncbi:MAG: YceD family protein [Candidatus Planktophila sp.]